MLILRSGFVFILSILSRILFESESVLGFRGRSHREPDANAFRLMDVVRISPFHALLHETFVARPRHAGSADQPHGVRPGLDPFSG